MIGSGQISTIHSTSLLLRDRHWQQISEELGVPIVIDNTFTVTKAIGMGLPQHLGVISKVADVAGKEYAIETALDKMQNEWKTIELQVSDTWRIMT